MKTVIRVEFEEIKNLLCEHINTKTDYTFSFLDDEIEFEVQDDKLVIIASQEAKIT